MIKIPDGLLAAEEPFRPDVQRVYWISGPLLDPDDPEDERPCVVVKVSDASPGVIRYVSRSTSERNGPVHDPQPAFGLNRRGWFNRVRTVSTELWTPSAARSTDLILDEITFSYVLLRWDL